MKTKASDAAPVTLPEVFAYAREHGCGLDAAFAHFKALGRIASEEPPKPVRDGWRPPDVAFVFSEDAAARADTLHSRASVEKAAREEFERVMLSMARRRQKDVTATNLVFSSFAMADGDYDAGYTIVPRADGRVMIEASRFETVAVDDEVDVNIPLALDP
jgi:hypothetical protein